MASEREGLLSCRSAQSSTAARRLSDNLIAVTGSRPVAGRPLPLLGATLFIILVLPLLTRIQ